MLERAEIIPYRQPQRLRGLGKSLPFRGDTEHGEPARDITTLKWAPDNGFAIEAGVTIARQTGISLRHD